MFVFGHHATGILEVEVFGYDLTPDGMTEHLIAVAVAGLLLLTMGYGVYAAARDFLDWRRGGRAAVHHGEMHP
jgi:hypothetical protein